MLKQPEAQQQEMEMVSIESLVPSGHLLRKIDRAVDFGFIRERVKHLYCEDNGRPALEPVVLFKLLLLGYLYGVRSERQLMREVEVNVAYRWFLGLRLRDKVPDASTLSQNRRRRFAESTIYQEIFDQIVLLAVNKGLASGAVLYTDSTHLKANANKNKYDLARGAGEAAGVSGGAGCGRRRGSGRARQGAIERQAIDGGDQGDQAEPYRSRLRLHGARRQAEGLLLSGPPHRRWPPRDHHRHLCDAGQRCTTRCRIWAGWTGSGSASASASARWASMPDMRPRRWHEGLEERNIYAVIGYRTPTHREGYFYKREFRYDQKLDVYICPNGQLIPYRTTNREGYRQYHSDPEQCRNCPVRGQCTESRNHTKVVTRHVWEAEQGTDRPAPAGAGRQAHLQAKKRDRGTQLRRRQTAARTPLRQDARTDQSAAAVPAGRHCPEHQEDRPAAGPNRAGYVLFNAPGSSQRLYRPAPAILQLNTEPPNNAEPNPKNKPHQNDGVRQQSEGGLRGLTFLF